MSEDNITIETNKENRSDNHIQIGDFLKSYRIKCGLSIEKISKETKIGVSLLVLLENNELTELPNKTYILGFVKSYAKIVNANQDECINILDQTYNSITPQTNNNSLTGVITQHHHQTKNSISKIVAVLGIMAIATFLIVRSYLGKSNNQLVINSTIKPQVLTSSSPLKKKTDRPEKIPVKPIEKETSNEELTVKKSEKKKIVNSVSVKKEEKLNKTEKEENKKTVVEEKDIKTEEINIILSPIKDEMFNLDPSPTDDVKKLLPEKVINKIVSNNQNIYVIANNGSTWITYKKDDNRIRQFLLKEGESTFISGKTVRMFIGKIAATTIFLNNVHIIAKATSKNGVKSLVFPKSARSQYKIPLFIYPKEKPAITSNMYEEMLNSNDE